MPFSPLQISGLRAVTFDAAGTLLDPHPSVGAVYAEVAATHGVIAAPEELERRFRAAFHARAKQPRPRTDEAAERAFWSDLCHEVFAPFADNTTMGRVFPELWETFAEAQRWRPREDAALVLETLHARGFRVAVLSNWDARLHRVLAGHGWTRWLNGGVFISSELGAEKPDPLVFARAAERLGCTPREILHVGDSPRQDAAGARDAGWHAALLGGPAGDGVHAITRLGELLARD